MSPKIATNTCKCTVACPKHQYAQDAWDCVRAAIDAVEHGPLMAPGIVGVALNSTLMVQLKAAEAKVRKQ